MYAELAGDIRRALAPALRRARPGRALADEYDESDARVLGKGSKERIAMLGRPALDAIKQWLPARKRLLSERKTPDHGGLWLNRLGKRLSARWIFETVVAR